MGLSAAGLANSCIRRPSSLIQGVVPGVRGSEVLPDGRENEEELLAGVSRFLRLVQWRFYRVKSRADTRSAAAHARNFPLQAFSLDRSLFPVKLIYADFAPAGTRLFPLTRPDWPGLRGRRR